MPVCQLMCSLAVPPAEESTRDVHGDEGDEEGDDESKDVDDEAIEEQDTVCEGPSRGVACNLNNNARKSRKVNYVRMFLFCLLTIIPTVYISNLHKLIFMNYFSFIILN